MKQPLAIFWIHLLPAAAAMAQVDPPSGIDFVTIGAPGNAPYQSPNPNDFVNNRGGVDHIYQIGRYEVTTAQFVEFFNAAFDRPVSDRLPHLIPPNFWGGQSTTPNMPGGLRWTVPAGNEMLPVGNISWRMAAMYCNWLCHDKSSDRAAFLSGSYDVSTFTFTGNIFNDQLVHTSGARYYIPTWDEQLKVFHYDPNRGGLGAGGWWQYTNGRDTAPVYGPPGMQVNGQLAQANAGWDSSMYPGRSPFAVPLGAYGVTSPWGLYDTAGGSAEWSESAVVSNDGTNYRVFDGSRRGQDHFQSFLVDNLRNKGAEFPHVSSYEFGFRVASSVPAPASCAAWAGVLVMLGTPRRRR